MFSVPFPKLQVEKSVVGPTAFFTVQEFLWHNYFAVSGSSARWPCDGPNGSFLQEGLCHMVRTQVYCSQSPCPCGSPLLTCDSAGDTQTLKGRSGHSLWGLQALVHTVWALQVSLVGMGFDSKCDFAPPTILLGLFLCPWTWVIFFWWDATLSCRWLFSSELRFWSSRRRKWAQVLLLCRLPPPSFLW